MDFQDILVLYNMGLCLDLGNVSIFQTLPKTWFMCIHLHLV